MADRRAFLGATLLVGAAFAAAAKPRPHKDPHRAALDLERDIPAQFADWTTDRTQVPLLPTADVQEKLQHIYTQQLIRSYRNAAGNGIMLLIAYGADQLELTTEVHSPEVCYPAQGFDILRRESAEIVAGASHVPVVRMLTLSPGRSEPLTYWITIGNEVVRNELDRRFARLRYTLRSIIPDGMLVRISSIDSDADRAWRIQEKFLGDLNRAVSAETRPRVFGQA